MAFKEINSSELKRELVNVYEAFTEDPLDKGNMEKVANLSNRYMNATNILEEPLASGVGLLEDLRVYGKGSGMGDSQILESSEKILEKLRKS